MLKDALKEVVVSIVGKTAEGIVDLLDGNNYINEFLIAKKLEITINQARNILYKLSDYGLVSSTRKKDKKKGWYTYFWKLEILKSLEFLKSAIERNINNFKSQLNNRETKQFFVCNRCNVEFTEENALLYNFTCRECGDVFQMKDNSKSIKDLKKNIDKMGNELKIVNEEIEKEKEKLNKKKVSEMKKEEKKKAAEKASKKLLANKNKPKKIPAKKIKTKEKKKKPMKKVLVKSKSKKISKSKKKKL